MVTLLWGKWEENGTIAHNSHKVYHEGSFEVVYHHFSEILLATLRKWKKSAIMLFMCPILKEVLEWHLMTTDRVPEILDLGT